MTKEETKLYVKLSVYMTGAQCGPNFDSACGDLEEFQTLPEEMYNSACQILPEVFEETWNLAKGSISSGKYLSTSAPYLNKLYDRFDKSRFNFMLDWVVACLSNKKLFDTYLRNSGSILKKNDNTDSYWMVITNHQNDKSMVITSTDQVEFNLLIEVVDLLVIGNIDNNSTVQVLRDDTDFTTIRDFITMTKFTSTRIV